MPQKIQKVAIVANFNIFDKAKSAITVAKRMIDLDCEVITSYFNKEKIERFGEAFDEGFGKNATLTPKNIISTSKFELEMPEVKIKVSPEHRDAISTQTINGQKYVMIKVTGAVEVNGINISIEE